MKNNGFTLIELLAVIIILGILMIIAIPSVTRYINDSRKNAYIDTAKEIISGARNLVNGGKLEMFDTDTTYYIDQECIGTENASKSPYGEFTKAYVVVTYNGKGYDYFWTSVDDAGQGISKITPLDKLDIDKIESDLNDNDIPDSLGVDGRSKYMIIDKQQTNCGKGVATLATDTVSGETGTNSVVYPSGKNKSSVVIGDIVKIGTEEFYVVRHQGNDLVLLARYNLKVGSIYNDYTKIRDYSSDEDGYGMQDATVLGLQDSSSDSNGVITFADTNYWNGKVGEGLDYPGNYCPSRSNTNCAEVFDSNSNLYIHVNNYANKLSKLGVTIKKARLLTLDEENLFLNSSKDVELFYTSFWLSSAFGNDAIQVVPHNRNFSDFSYYNYNRYGVRPVIEI